MVLELLPARPASRPLRVLCLGAHSDDIEIGCAGTLLRLLNAEEHCEIRWVVFSGTEQRAREATASAQRLVGDHLHSVNVLGFRDTYFPGQWAALKDAFRNLKGEASPDLIFTHRQGDHHQDHRVVSELTWNTFRDHLILEYEVPKWDGDLGQPNLYVPLERETARRKARHLVEAFPSQRDRPWFDVETFMGLTRLRGVECAAEGNHAEGLHGQKLVMGFRNH